MGIAIKDLSVRFGYRQVLEGISMEMGEGVYCVIGANGSGKTTFFKSILGLIPFRGEIRKTDMKIGYLPQHFDTLRGLSVYESMQYFCCLKKIPKEKEDNEINRVLQMVHMDDERRKSLSKLSGGMFQRIGIAQVLIGDSDLLILDEPTAGLDVVEKRTFRSIMKDMETEKNGKIVLISSHEMAGLEIFCDYAIFLYKGHVLRTGRLEKLFLQWNTDSLEDIFMNLIRAKS